MNGGILILFNELSGFLTAFAKCEILILFHIIFLTKIQENASLLTRKWPSFYLIWAVIEQEKCLKIAFDSWLI